MAVMRLPLSNTTWRRSQKFVATTLKGNLDFFEGAGRNLPGEKIFHAFAGEDRGLAQNGEVQDNLVEVPEADVP